jgi:hypothetical protein
MEEIDLMVFAPAECGETCAAMDRWHILPSMGYELNKITLGGTLGLVESESSWNKERLSGEDPTFCSK